MRTLLLALALMGCGKSEKAKDPPSGSTEIPVKFEAQGPALSNVLFGPWQKDWPTWWANIKYVGPGPVNRIGYTMYDANGVKLETGVVDCPELKAGEFGRCDFLSQQRPVRVVIDVE